MTSRQDLPRLRTLVGESAALWAGRDGVSVQEHGWTALSGARSVDYNVIFTAGDGEDLEASMARIRQAGLPAVLMVGGSGLGEVQRLIEASWVCIGSTPLMVLDGLGTVPGADAGPQARQLASDELDLARELVARVFDVGPELAAVAIPPDIAHRPDISVWGAFDDAARLQSCLAAVRTQEMVAIWSMATATAVQGRGHGRRVLLCALAHGAAAGATASILYASRDAEPFYRALGYRERERWQLWSRPRWVLGRA